MKIFERFLSGTIAVALIISISACGTKHTQEGTVFLGRIETIEENILSVAPEIMTKEYKKSKVITIDITEAGISDSEGKEVSATSLSQGMEIYITYNENDSRTTDTMIYATHIQMKDIAINTSPPVESPKDVLKYSLNGETKAINAKRIALNDCYIKVPSENWEESILDDAGCGPIEVYYTEEENSKIVITQRSLTIQEGQDYFNKRYGDLEWKTWERDISLGFAYEALYSEYIEEDLYYTFYVSECSTGVVILETDCPIELVDGTGSLLQAMANSLYVNPQ
jgi:uncharacterized lipoprotein YehR (DUF1307 family)